MQPSLFSLLIVFELFYQDSCFMGLVPEHSGKQEQCCTRRATEQSLPCQKSITYEAGYVIKNMKMFRCLFIS